MSHRRWWTSAVLDRRVAAAVLIGALAGAGAAGCTSTCADTLTCPYVESSVEPAGDEPACPDDPKDGPVAPECGVWVSASAGDDANPGTQEAPVKSIAAGVALAQGATMRVHLCGETYEEAVELPSGIALFGGFDCQHEWAYLGSGAKARIQPGLAGVIPLTLREGDRVSVLRDVDVTAASAVEPAGSSIGVLALPGSKVEIWRSTITAGDGADGEHGEDGTHGAATAQKGLSGKLGTDACWMDIGLGGAAVWLGCEDGSSSHGGQGGDGGEAAANDGGDGLPAVENENATYGLGGNGENALSGAACTPGIGGAHGDNGMEGEGAKGPGRLTPKGFFGAAGEDGGSGLPGQGGGGGGGSRGKLACGGPNGGAGGGSGGTGGCGGRGGKGGQAGGASIGLASLSPEIYLYETSLVTGKGGRGGDGGSGQPGGQGGLPGLGGAGLTALDPVLKGCAGGAGGYGGDGGNGGGGRGGHSAPVVHTPGNQPKGQTPTLAFWQPGEGGLGGNKASLYGEGENGDSSFVVLDD